MKKIILCLLSSVLILCCDIVFASPMTSHSNAGAILTEYYDYECPHCRKMDSVIDRLKAQYPKLDVVYKATPLLNGASKPVASFALAAKIQNQWLAVHRLLMRSRSSPSLADIKRIVAQLGLNTRQILSTMGQASVHKQIQQNIHQAGRYAVHSVIYLPIMVFKSNHGQTIVLRGKQPYALLSAIVKQFSDTNYVQKNKKITFSGKQTDTKAS